MIKIGKRDLLTLLISLFILTFLNACKSPNNIGLETSSNDVLNGDLMDDFAIEVTVENDDTLITSGLYKYPFGYFKDPVFGTTEANLAMQITAPTYPIAFKTNAVIDSVVLSLRYYPSFYGDSTSRYVVDVFPLTERLNSGATYYSSGKTWKYNSGALLGEKIIQSIKYKDSISVTRIVAGKPDSLNVKVAPQIRIPLDKSYFQNNLMNASSEKLQEDSVFKDYFKGLYATINKISSSGTGGILFLDLNANATSNLEIYYKAKNNGIIDTLVQYFYISNGASKIAANIKHDATGTEVGNLLNNNTVSPKKVYLKSMGGLRAKIRFPNLKKINNLGKIAINKAELILPISAASDAPFLPTGRLTAYCWDKAHQRKYIPDNASGNRYTAVDSRWLGDAVFDGKYRTDTKDYRITLTGLIQDMLNDQIQDNMFFVAPNDPISIADFYPTALTGGRTIIENNSQAAKKMKLRVLYTVKP